MGQGQANNYTCLQRYEKANNTENPENANFMGVAPMISILKPVKYKEYKALAQYYKESKQGKFSIIIGGAVIEIVAENQQNEKGLIEAADKIDAEKIIKYFGK